MQFFDKFSFTEVVIEYFHLVKVIILSTASHILIFSCAHLAAFCNLLTSVACYNLFLFVSLNGSVRKFLRWDIFVKQNCTNVCGWFLLSLYLQCTGRWQHKILRQIDWTWSVFLDFNLYKCMSSLYKWCLCMWVLSHSFIAYWFNS